MATVNGFVVKTAEQYDKLAEQLDKQGIRWASGKKASAWVPFLKDEEDDFLFQKLMDYDKKKGIFVHYDDGDLYFSTPDGMLDGITMICKEYDGGYIETNDEGFVF